MQTPNAIPGLIQVLWIEDDPVVTNSYPAEAEQYDLQLVHFPCWDDAKVALESNFNRWEAIILDAKCKVHAETGKKCFTRRPLTESSFTAEYGTGLSVPLLCLSISIIVMSLMRLNLWELVMTCTTPWKTCLPRFTSQL